MQGIILGDISPQVFHGKISVGYLGITEYNTCIIINTKWHQSLGISHRRGGGGMHDSEPTAFIHCLLYYRVLSDAESQLCRRYIHFPPQSLLFAPLHNVLDIVYCQILESETSHGRPLLYGIISATSDFPNITFITYVESWSESKFVPKTSKTAHRLENLYVVSPLTGSLPH